MNIALIQHTKDSPAGSTLEWIAQRKCNFTHYKLFESSTLPSLNSFDVLFICGGAMNVDDEEKFGWMKAEKKLIRDAIDSKKRIVGLCLGGQLIAEVLGARVSRHPHWEVGWQEVKLNAIHCADIPLNQNPLKVFQWHGYSFDTPSGAESFATNSLCLHQGFCFQGVALGMQFHPESNLDWIRECAADPELPNSAESLPGTKSIQTSEEILNGSSNLQFLQNWYFALLNSFLK